MPTLRCAELRPASLCAFVPSVTPWPNAFTHHRNRDACLSELEDTRQSSTPPMNYRLAEAWGRLCRMSGIPVRKIASRR